ncbi:MAG: hypothetical protein AB7P52_02640 [Alphaproteobacteria bacterium]
MNVGRSLSGLPCCLGAIGLGAMIGLSPPGLASAADGEALARAIADTPFDQSQLRDGYRLLETVGDEPVPPEAAEYGIVAGVMSSFESPREHFREALAFYLIFASKEQAEDYYDFQFVETADENSGLFTITELTVETPDHAAVRVLCYLSAAGEAFSCMYLEAELATVIQIVAGPSPGYHESTDEEQLFQAFLISDGPLALSGVMTAARTHLLRAAGR